VRARLFENLVESGLTASGTRRLGALPMSLAIHALLVTGAAVGPLLLATGPMPGPARALRQIICVAPSLLPAPPPPSRDEPAPRPGVRQATGPPASLPRLDAGEPVTGVETTLSGPPEGVPSTESSETGMTIGEPGDPPAGASWAPRTPLRVGQVREPRKLKHLSPGYPEIARAARVQGVVVLECVIDEQGRVREIKVLKGLPLLDQAAIDAVRQWVYTPTLLGGVPVPVVMTVTVNFRLS
jgi:protein TonB